MSTQIIVELSASAARPWLHSLHDGAPRATRRDRGPGRRECRRSTRCAHLAHLSHRASPTGPPVKRLRTLARRDPGVDEDQVDAAPVPPRGDAAPPAGAADPASATPPGEDPAADGMEAQLLSLRTQGHRDARTHRSP